MTRTQLTDVEWEFIEPSLPISDQALLEVLIAEAAKRGEVDLPPARIDSAAVRAHHER
ncbi:hypothetical protein ACGFSB_36905 [Streptomyces sp. NPDC048441]|uniref:hypothetical protein n=1 Tax=Streptomyces sp. NPDC048441 TaxID=3365552 RepID=UPI0037151F15